jgi:hypothetical protein
LLSLYLINSDYIINENNNIIIFREHIPTSNDKKLYSQNLIAEIPPGNYTEAQLVTEVSTQMSSISGKNYYTSLQPITNKFIITTIYDPTTATIEEENIVFDIIIKGSTLLNILGFDTINQHRLSNKSTHISVNPIKLIKSPFNNLELYIKIKNEDDDEEAPIKIFNEPLLFNENTGIMIFDKTLIEKKFRSPINLDEILVKFTNYNTRGYDFNLIAELTTIQI